MALAPGIARKVKKVLETPVDSPEILSCLRSLSDFYPENTPAARRGLRRSVERHGLEINREYLVASNRAQEALRAVDGQLERLLDSCDRIGGALERTRERTGALLRETAELDAVIASVEEKKRIVATFAAAAAAPLRPARAGTAHRVVATVAPANTRAAEPPAATLHQRGDETTVMMSGPAGKESMAKLSGFESRVLKAMTAPEVARELHMYVTQWEALNAPAAGTEAFSPALMLGGTTVARLAAVIAT